MNSNEQRNQHKSGATGNRTLDLMHAKHALYQLSHDPSYLWDPNHFSRFCSKNLFGFAVFRFVFVVGGWRKRANTEWHHRWNHWASRLLLRHHNRRVTRHRNKIPNTSSSTSSLVTAVSGRVPSCASLSTMNVCVCALWLLAYVVVAVCCCLLFVEYHDDDDGPPMYNQPINTLTLTHALTNAHTHNLICVLIDAISHQPVTESNTSTVGVEFGTKKITVGDRVAVIQLWDTGKCCFLTLKQSVCVYERRSTNSPWLLTWLMTLIIHIHFSCCLCLFVDATNYYILIDLIDWLDRPMCEIMCHRDREPRWHRITMCSDMKHESTQTTCCNVYN